MGSDAAGRLIKSVQKNMNITEILLASTWHAVQLMQFGPGRLVMHKFCRVVCAESHEARVTVCRRLSLSNSLKPTWCFCFICSWHVHPELRILKITSQPTDHQRFFICHVGTNSTHYVSGQVKFEPMRDTRYNTQAPKVIIHLDLDLQHLSSHVHHQGPCHLHRQLDDDRWSAHRAMDLQWQMSMLRFVYCIISEPLKSTQCTRTVQRKMSLAGAWKQLRWCSGCWQVRKNVPGRWTSHSKSPVAVHAKSVAQYVQNISLSGVERSLEWSARYWVYGHSDSWTYNLILQGRFPSNKHRHSTEKLVVTEFLVVCNVCVVYGFSILWWFYHCFQILVFTFYAVYYVYNVHNK